MGLFLKSASPIEHTNRTGIVKCSHNVVSHTSGAQAGRRSNACGAVSKLLQWLQGLPKPYLIASRKTVGVPLLQKERGKTSKPIWQACRSRERMVWMRRHLLRGAELQQYPQSSRNVMSPLQLIRGECKSR